MDYIKVIAIINIYLLSLLLISCGTNTNEKSGSQAIKQIESHLDVGIALYSFNRFSFSESLEKAKRAGAKYVEGFYFHKLGDDFNNRLMLELSDGEVAEMKGMIDEQGLQMRSLYAGAESESGWKNLFELGRKLEIKFLVCEPEPEHWDLLDSLSGEYGIKIAIHQHAKGHSRFWHPDSVKLAMEGRPNFGICGDLGHWVRSGLDPVKCLAQLEGRLISIHAKDLDEFGNIKANDVKISSGVIDYKSVIKELNKQNFRGPIYIECEHDWENNLEDVEFAVQYLNGLTVDKFNSNLNAKRD